MEKVRIMKPDGSIVEEPISVLGPLQDGPVEIPGFNTPTNRRSWLEFLRLFTLQEQYLIAAAAISDPAVMLWWSKASGATWIELDHPDTASGLDALIAGNLLAAGRKGQILAGEEQSLDAA
jgi:hypothetical protein